MNCPRCGKPMRVITTDSGGAYVCQPCIAERQSRDRIRDAVIERAATDTQQRKDG